MGQSFKDISSLGLKRFACSVEGHFGVSGGFSPFFPEVVLEPCRLVTLQSLLGLDPQARHGEMPDPSHHLLIPGSRNLGVSKILSYGKDFSPLILLCHITFVKQKVRAFQSFPVGNNLKFPAAPLTFQGSGASGLVHSQFKLSNFHVQSSQGMFLLGKSNSTFSSLQHSAHMVFSWETRECFPLNL